MINIVLIGMRGSGKSTLAKLLSFRSNMEQVDTDTIIAEKEKMPTGEIIRKKGLVYFRRLESEIIEKISHSGNLVISTGGGAVENKTNMDLLKKNGVVVYLKSYPENLVKRIGNDPGRPLLTGAGNMLGDLHNLSVKRSALYEKFSDLEIDSDKFDLRIPDRYSKLCCLIGNPVAHSASPVMHNAAYRSLGLNYYYFAAKVSDLEKSVSLLKAVKVTGISVTVPFKTEVLDYSDSAEETVTGIGAANTLILRDGKIIAYNTDVAGAITSLKEVSELAEKKVVIKGAGGAARAIAWGLKRENAKVYLTNRTYSKAEILIENLGLDGIVRADDRNAISKADILINASTLGMIPSDPLPFSGNSLRPRQVVFDIVYNPPRTKLLKAAESAGCRTVSGYKMLIYQGLAQFRLFTGKDAPVDTFSDALLQSLDT